MSEDESKREGKLRFAFKGRASRSCHRPTNRAGQKSSLKLHDIAETVQSFAKKKRCFFKRKLKSVTCGNWDFQLKHDTFGELLMLFLWLDEQNELA